MLIYIAHNNGTSYSVELPEEDFALAHEILEKYLDNTATPEESELVAILDR